MRADAIFIGVEVDDAVAQRRGRRGQARRGLPGRHLRRRAGGHMVLVEENLDECVLCGLCLDAAPRGRGAGAQALRRGRRAAARAEPPRAEVAHTAHAPTGRLLRMPELPEAERARATIERGALLRRIVDGRRRRQLRLPPARARRDRRRARRPRADRRAPPRQGDVGRDLRRRAGARACTSAWPGASRSTRSPRRAAGTASSCTSRTAARLALRDKRRLGRARLEPDLAALGPDAAEIGRDEFRARVGRGSAPLKARLMDQAVVAGRGQPAGRRDPLARAPGSAPPGRRAEHRRSSTACAARCAPRCARRCAAAAPTPATSSPRAGAAPCARAAATEMAARDGRRPHDLLVPGGAALMIRSRPVERIAGKEDLGAVDCGALMSSWGRERAREPRRAGAGQPRERRAVAQRGGHPAAHPGPARARRSTRCGSSPLIAAFAVAWGVLMLSSGPVGALGPVRLSHVSTVLEPGHRGRARARHRGHRLAGARLPVVRRRLRAFFYPPRQALAYWLACGVVHALPLLYDGHAVEGNLARELVVVVPIYCLVGGVVVAGRELLAGAMRRAARARGRASGG